jgi:hypothetical protein
VWLHNTGPTEPEMQSAFEHWVAAYAAWSGKSHKRVLKILGWVTINWENSLVDCGHPRCPCAGCGFEPMGAYFIYWGNDAWPTLFHELMHHHLYWDFGAADPNHQHPTAWTQVATIAAQYGGKP